MSAARARVVIGAVVLAAVAVPAAAFARGGIGGGGNGGSGGGGAVVVPVDPAPVDPAPVVVDPAPVPVDPAPVDPAPVVVDPAPAPVDPAPVVVDPAPVPVDPAPVVVDPAPAPAPADPPPTVPTQIQVPVTPPTPPPCAKIVSFKASGGFRQGSNRTIGAIWTSLKVANCGTETATFHIDLIETVDGRPDLTFVWSPVVSLAPAKDFSAGNIDNDSTPLDTPYHVSLEVRSDDGTLVTSTSVDVVGGQ